MEENMDMRIRTFIHVFRTLRIPKKKWLGKIQFDYVSLRRPGPWEKKFKLYVS